MLLPHARLMTTQMEENLVRQQILASQAGHQAKAARLGRAAKCGALWGVVMIVSSPLFGPGFPAPALFGFGCLLYAAWVGFEAGRYCRIARVGPDDDDP